MLDTHEVAGSIPAPPTIFHQTVSESRPKLKFLFGYIYGEFMFSCTALLGLELVHKPTQT